MRLVQFVLPPDDRERVLGVLDDQRVDHVRLPGEDGTLVGVRSTVPVVGSDYGVTVVVERPAGQSYGDLVDRVQANLVDRVQANLVDRTGRSVPVEVQFVDRVRSSPDSYAANAPWYQYARLAAR